MDKTIKILIAEDEPPIARMLAKMIQNQDKEMEILGIARNGREALRLLEEKMPDVIFTDIRMPVMDGLALIEEVQKKTSSVKFVILSGYQEFDYARRAIQLNVTEYLLKPVSETMLSEILAKLKVSVHQEQAKTREGILGQLYDKYRTEAKEIQPGDCMAAILCIGSLPAIEDENMFPGSLLWAKQGMDKKVEELLLSGGFQGTFWGIPGLTSVEHILIYEDAEKSDDEKLSLMRRIYKLAAREMKIPVTMISKSQGIDIASIGAAHLQMRKEMYNRIYFGYSAFIAPDSVTGPGSVEVPGSVKVSGSAKVPGSVKGKDKNDSLDSGTKRIKSSLLEFCEACGGDRCRFCREDRKKFLQAVPGVPGQSETVFQVFRAFGHLWL